MAEVKVYNKDIYAALQAMGYAPAMGPVNPADLVGNQHGEFLDRMLKQFNISEDVFKKAEEVAKRINLGGGLQQVRPDDVRAIIQNVDDKAPLLKSGQQLNIDAATGTITFGTPQPAPQTGPWLPGKAPGQPGQPAPAPKAGDFAMPGPEKAPYIYRGDIKLTPEQRAANQPKPNVPGSGTTTAPPGGGGPVAPPALSKNATEEEIQKHVRQYYGFMAWGLDIPEIRQLVLDIAQNPSTQWTQEAVNGRIQSTNWWQQNGINVQTWLQRRASDPRTTQTEIKDKFEEFRNTAKAGGIEIPEQRLWDMAEESLKWKWSESTIQAVIGAEYRFDPSKPTAQTENVKKMASDFLVPMSDEATGYWTKQLLTGQKTQDEYKQFLVQQAKSMFPQLSAPLDRGEPLSVYLDSYKQRAAQLLEQDPDNINLMDTKWQRLLTRVDPKTGERSMMDLADMEQVIRTDPQYGYDYTKGARDEASSLASSLMKKMGVIA